MWTPYQLRTFTLMHPFSHIGQHVVISSNLQVCHGIQFIIVKIKHILQVNVSNDLPFLLYYLHIKKCIGVLLVDIKIKNL